MNYEGTVYRPPLEANSFLLQVAIGCTHNKCTYCNMYAEKCFRVESLKKIEEDLKLAKQYYKTIERIFLVDGDAFVLKTELLKSIALMIKKYFPECKTITMYASIQNIKAKTIEELKELKELGINDLYVGIESGSDEVLAHVNKGHTVKEAIEQLEKLNEANINHMSIIMLGISGKGKGIENAKATAKLLNNVKPKIIINSTLSVFEGTKLYEELQNGTFVEARELENLMEEKTLIENLELDETFFFGNHVFNSTSVSGILGKDKESMIKKLEHSIENFDEDVFERTFKRTQL